MARDHDGLTDWLYNNIAVVSGEPLTMACWFNSDRDDLTQGLMWIGDKDVGNKYHAMCAAGAAAGDLIYVQTRDTITTASATSSSGFTANQWHHACGVWRDVDDRQAYIDGGNSSGPNTDTRNAPPIDRVAIGVFGDSDRSAYFDGDIAEAAIWNVALTAAEIAALAKGISPLLIRPGNLVAYWPLIRGLNDRVGGYNLTASGTTVSEHPRVIYPSGIILPPKATALGQSFTIHSVDGFADAGYRYQRKLARTSNGDLHSVYHRSITGTKQICYAKSIDDGENWSETVLTSESYDQTFPSIAVDSSDNLHVVWPGKHSGSTTYNQIRYRKYTDSWQSIENVTSDSHEHFTCSIAVDSNDDLHVAFAGHNATEPTYDQIMYVKNDGSWSGITDISENDDYYQNTPTISVAPNGNIHIFWYGKHSGSATYNQIRHRVYTTSWQSIENVTSSSYNNWDPCCAIDSSGYLHLVHTNSESGDNIRYQLYNGSWQTPVDITTGSTYTQIDAGIAVDGDDYLHVFWEGYTSDFPSTYQVRYRFNDGSWGSITEITESATAQRVPNAVWAYHPTVSEARTNRPATGFAFIWAAGTTLKYFRSFDLTWDAASGIKYVSGTVAATSSLSGPAKVTRKVAGTIAAASTLAVTPSLTRKVAGTIAAAGALAASVKTTKTITGTIAGESSLVATAWEATIPISGIIAATAFLIARATVEKWSGVSKPGGAWNEKTKPSANWNETAKPQDDWNEV